MPELMNAAAEHRLTEYFDRISEVLGRPERRASFAVYAFGILDEGERKSLEPFAARARAIQIAQTPSINDCITSHSTRRGTIMRFASKQLATRWRR